jgi:Fic family protein
MAAISEIQHAPRGTLAFNRLVAIVRGEYLEMPGLRLTRQQAQRLWALDAETCEALLRTLEERNVLRRTSSGHYVLGHPH